MLQYIFKKWDNENGIIIKSSLALRLHTNLRGFESRYTRIHASALISFLICVDPRVSEAEPTKTMDTTLVEFLNWLGQVVLGLYFLMLGLRRVMKKEEITKKVSEKKVPSPKVVVMASAVLLVVGGVGIIFNSFINWAVLAVAAFLLPAALKMHDFWNVKENEEKTKQMGNFARNIALTGALLMLL